MSEYVINPLPLPSGMGQSLGQHHNAVWREVHRSPTKLGHRIFDCKHCHATKTTKRNIPKVCEFCGANIKSGNAL